MVDKKYSKPQWLFSCDCGKFYIGTAVKRRCSVCYATNIGVRLGKK